MRYHADELPVDSNVPTPGERVRHPSFGVGQVIEIQGYGQSLMAVVDFRAGRKTLLLEYARLQRLG
ncbi:MAG: hypothetical protein ACUZ8A_00010 [Candidatus Bathyanammoxibius sp.]